MSLTSKFAQKYNNKIKNITKKNRRNKCHKLTTIIESKRMYVRKEFRGQGIAVEILQNLENWALALDFNKCVLETGIHQADAITLYLKCNYSKTHNYGQYQGIATSICFEKVLKPD